MRLIRLLDPEKKCKCGHLYGIHKNYYGLWRVSGCEKCDKICLMDTENVSKEEAQTFVDKIVGAEIMQKFGDFERIVEILADNKE